MEDKTKVILYFLLCFFGGIFWIWVGTPMAIYPNKFIPYLCYLVGIGSILFSFYFLYSRVKR